MSPPTLTDHLNIYIFATTHDKSESYRLLEVNAGIPGSELYIHGMRLGLTH